jgi:hypothetical protein
VKRPGWTSSRTARRWLAVTALVLLFLAGRVALRSFGAQTRLPDGARVYATCKAPLESARIGDPGDRFTLWVMTGAPAERRPEGIAALGALCQENARRRMALVVAVLAGGGVLAWLAMPERLCR